MLKLDLILQIMNQIDHLNVNNRRKNHKEFIKNNKLISKSEQRFTIDMHHVFTEEINITALSANNDKRMQTIDAIETYAYGTNKDLVNEK